MSLVLEQTNVLKDRAVLITVDTISIFFNPRLTEGSLDVQFRVRRSLKPEPNTCEVAIYNLNEDHRNQLHNLPEAGCTVAAGYADLSGLIFQGSVRNAWTFREGPDLVTRLSTADGEKEAKAGRINKTVAKEEKNAGILGLLQKAIGVGEGNIAKINAELNALPPLMPTGGTLSGKVSDQITKHLRTMGYEWSIQNGNLQVLKLGRPIDQTAIRLTSNTGLTGSPVLDGEYNVSLQTLMIADIVPGKIIDLETEFLSGQYRVETCEYVGATFGNDWYINIEARGANAPLEPLT